MKRTTNKALVLWETPPPGWLKFTMNVVVNGYPRQIGIRGYYVMMLSYGEIGFLILYRKASFVYFSLYCSFF
ncbi:Uncharacterized protein TCM_028040 [Theobroma cacao]|uniref:Uncharacterized protein n=1 Tax=Theobroma cacao TaxID=3641 RepID=A0A061GB98_THECC|nr:Uncharacterized protein TCM_028040 [Theobroma cacao]